MFPSLIHGRKLFQVNSVFLFELSKKLKKVFGRFDFSLIAFPYHGCDWPLLKCGWEVDVVAGDPLDLLGGVVVIKVLHVFIFVGIHCAWFFSGIYPLQDFFITNFESRSRYYIKMLGLLHMLNLCLFCRVNSISANRPDFSQSKPLKIGTS